MVPEHEGSGQSARREPETRAEVSAPRGPIDLAWMVLATFFGAGKLPIAPGTWGSLFTVLLYALALHPMSTAALAIAVVAVSLVGVASATAAERILARHDPGEVVIDEVAGQLIAILPLHHFGRTSPGLLLVSFLAFRVFDVLKPFPCYQLQSLRGGWGVMADDVMAGIYAAIVAYGATFILR
jgi:phosphatidylglycerophosphatase A